MIITVASLGACGQKPPVVVLPEVFPRVSSEPVIHPTSIAPVLMQRFYVQQQHNSDKEIEFEATYRGLKYQPRTSNYPGYVGWDILTVPRSDSSRADWLVFKLHRPAKVAIAWNEKAAWLSAWTPAGDIPGGFKSYTKDFPAGEHKLPSPGRDNDAYELLFAETSGTPSSAPTLPTEAPAGATLPQPNTTCPDWLHHMYSVEKGGIKYDSWHPQIDPVYWCYFKHEHGGDPSLIGYNGAALEYVAKLFNDQAEIHEGFKNFVIRDESTNVGWYISVHAETGFEHRVCTRFHTVVIAAVGLKDTANFTKGELLAELGFKGDFGASLTNQEFAGKRSVIDKKTLAGGACLDQKAINTEITAAKSKAEKTIRVSADPFGNNGYEGWNGGIQKLLGFSFPDWHGGLNIDIRNPSTACATLECTALDRNKNDHGDERTLFMSGVRLTYDRRNDTVNGSAADGVFYTDLYGATFYDADASGRIRQFIKPNLNVSLPDGSYTTEDAWRGLYVKDGFVPRIELEDALGTIN